MSAADAQRRQLVKAYFSNQKEASEVGEAAIHRKGFGYEIEGLSQNAIIAMTKEAGTPTPPSLGGGQNKSRPKSYAKVEQIRNDAVDPMCNIRSLWIAIDMRQF